MELSLEEVQTICPTPGSSRHSVVVVVTLQSVPVSTWPLLSLKSPSVSFLWIGTYVAGTQQGLWLITSLIRPCTSSETQNVPWPVRGAVQTSGQRDTGFGHTFIPSYSEW